MRVALILALSFAARAHAADPPAPENLKDAAGGLFDIGVGIHDRIAERVADHRLLLAQFSVIAPENCMKPALVQPAEGEWRFAQADRFVEFAAGSGLELVGHCLVWAKDDRTPAWFYRDGEESAGRELLLDRMRRHIDATVKRYRGRIASWDVVNEALDDGNEYLRVSGWSRACGEEFIARAFEYAHAADPDALLVYNDYNNELPAKREKQIRLVRSLRGKNVPIHAVGLQGHYEIDRVPFGDIEDTLVAMRQLGMKVVISELDIDVIPRARWWADGGRHREEMSRIDPYRNGCPPDILKRQADQYAQLFRIFRKHADTIARVSFWNLHDGQSWLNDFPWKRVNHPLLFDRQRNPKPAYAAVVKALTEPLAQDRRRPRGVPRTDRNSQTAHEQLLAKARKGGIDVYFVGDSITRRWGTSDPQYRDFLANWRKNFFGWNAANFGWGGDTVQNVLWRLENGELDGVHPKVIILMAGTNNVGNRGADDAKVDVVVAGIQATLDVMRDRAPGATIVLMGITPRNDGAGGTKTVATIDRINERIAQLADEKTVRYLNINGRLADRDGRLFEGVTVDGLHLSLKGFQVWADALKPVLTEVLGPPARTDHAPEPTGDPSAPSR